MRGRTDRALPLWRSFLFVPVLNERFIASAPDRGADVVQLDLEDSIPPDRKEAGRERLPSAADDLYAAGCTVVVRINRPWRMAVRDMEAAVRPSVAALTLPKVPDAGHVRAVAEFLDELEAERGLPPGHTALIAMIETAEGLIGIDAIAAAHPRLVGITVGAEDLAVDLCARPGRSMLLGPNMRAVVAARAAGILPIGYVGSVADYSDLEAFAATIREARSLGFTGGFAIHPNQVPVLNREFLPSLEEVDDAHALIAAFDDAISRGAGAASFRGRMIDLPVVEQARALLRAHEAAKADGRRTPGPTS